MHIGMVFLRSGLREIISELKDTYDFFEPLVLLTPKENKLTITLRLGIKKKDDHATS